MNEEVLKAAVVRVLVEEYEMGHAECVRAVEAAWPPADVSISAEDLAEEVYSGSAYWQ